MKIKIYSLYGFLIFCLLCMSFLGIKAYDKAIAYEQITTEMVILQGATEQAKLQLEKLATVLVGDLFQGTRENNYILLQQKQEAFMLEAKRYTQYFMLFVGIVLCSYFFIALRAYVFFGALTALLSLFFGLISPILMVTIHKEVEYLGDIVLSFESKGIIGSILKLFDNGDWVVAIVIVVFSVIVPILKVTALLFLSLFIKHQFIHRVVNFFKMIGKWSMVDVFVVAIFLVYLTANKAEVSRAEIEVGLYFFLAYVLVSMLVSLGVDRMVHQSKI